MHEGRGRTKTMKKVSVNTAVSWRERTAVKTKSQPPEEPGRRAEEIPSQVGEIIITISDDDDDDGMGEKAEGRNTNGEEEENTEAGGEKHREREDEIVTPGTESLLNLIKKYILRSNEKAELALSHILSPDYTRDLVQVCSHTPYCLYRYSGVALGDGLTATVLLVGYYDQSSGRAVLKLLHARPPPSETDVTPAESESPLGEQGALDSHRLIQTLIQLGLSLYNLAVFYCDSPDPGVSAEVEARLRVLRPGLVSLCSLSGLAGRACSDGLGAAFGTVAELVQHVHAHFSNASLPDDAGLMELAACSRHYQPSVPIATQCIFLSHMVVKMSHAWHVLEDYFQSLAPSPEAQRICLLLKRRDVRLGALYLCQALLPLCTFQEAQQPGGAELSVQLQLLAVLGHAYAACILKSPCVAPYLERRDRSMLRNVNFLLPDSELKLSPQVSEYLSTGSKGTLGDGVWERFLADVVAFTQAVLESIGARVPGELGFTPMQHMGLLLTPPREGKVGVS